MVSSFFSRPKSHDSDRSKSDRQVESHPKPVHTAEPEKPQADGGNGQGRHAAPSSASSYDEGLRRSVAEWAKQMDEATRSFADDPKHPVLDLTYAHPGGMAQLFALRSTPLSLLIREPGEAQRARATVRAIMDKVREVATDHGMAQVHMAFGHASWRSEDGKRVAPMLLSPVDLKLDSSGDATVRISATLSVSPEIVEAAQSAGIALDTDAIVEAAFGAHGFSAVAALTKLRRTLSVLPGFESDERMAMSIFVHPAAELRSELQEADKLLQSNFVRALAGDEPSTQRIKKELRDPVLEDRDPWQERGIGDQLPETLDLVESVVTGSNVMFDTSGGANPTPVLASIAADAAANGRKVVVVGANRHNNDAFWHYLDDAGLSHAVARVDGASDAESNLINQVARVFNDESPFVDRESIELMRTELRRVRESLAKHTEELHRPIAEWGVSAYDALQVLTDLTSTRPGPRTKVRFSADTLTTLARDIDDQAKSALRAGIEQGMFSKGSSQDPWFGAVISSPDQVGSVLEVVARLSESLPKLRVAMSSTAGQTGLNPATTFKEWEEQLLTLEGVRQALDVFQPAIFERPIADMVIATASKQWRRDHGYPMQRRQRKHLVKSAKDMLRPGRYVEDLNEELRKVQRQRDVWRKHQATDGWPKVPSGLEEMREHARVVKDDLTKLDTHLATAHGPLQRMDIGELSLLVDRLHADPNGARALPERLNTLKVLHKFGLDALVKDLRERNVPASLIEKELDLAWWASALGVMLARVPSLGGFDPASLQNLIVDLQRLDREQVASLSAVASDKIRRRRVEQMARYFEEESRLRASVPQLVASPDAAVELYSSSPLTRAMFPIVVTSPVIVPKLRPLEPSIDLLILEDVNRLPLAELIPLVARARQLVVTADKSSETETVTALENVTVTARIEPEPVRVNEFVGRLFNRYRIAHAGVPVPVPRTASKLTIEYVDGRGMPAPDKAAVESSQQEVDAVTEMVIEHALLQPEKSLALVALNEVHAQRLQDSLAQMASKSPALESFFRQERPDPFVIVTPATKAHLQRERVILSVGFAKTPHGRVLHDFGLISEADGLTDLAHVLGVASGELNIVSSVHPAQFDRDRFSSDGPKLLLDLMLSAEAACGIGSGLPSDGVAASGVGGSSRAGSAGSVTGVSTGLVAEGSAESEESEGAAGVAAGDASSSTAPGSAEAADAGTASTMIETQSGGTTTIQTESGATWPTFEAKPDQLLIDLADRLYSVGLTVIPNLGVEGSFRVPLAIGHPQFPDELLVAVLTDDDTYVAERSLRRRDRYWPELLEANGWKTRTSLSMAVFIDPQSEADKIIDMVLDAVDERMAEEADARGAGAVSGSVSGSAGVSAGAAGSGSAGISGAAAGAEASGSLAGEGPASTSAGADSLSVRESASASHSASLEGGATASAMGETQSGEPANRDSDPKRQDSGEEMFGTETAAQRMIRIQADEDIHGTAEETVWRPSGVERGRRPEVAVGLPLAAYSDDQLDEIALWIVSDGLERTEDQLIEEIQSALGLTRRGAQVDAVLRNVARRISK